MRNTTAEDIRFAKLLVLLNGLAPFVLLLWDSVNRQLGANPLEFVTHTTGTLTLVFLLLTLAVTPLRKLLGLPWMVQVRRSLGLFAFFYGALHLTAYIWFDKYFNPGAIIEDTTKRPFIFFGMAGFLLMAPLALTSTNRMVKRLGGKRWKRLHQAVYFAAAAGVLHYWMLVKADIRIPMAFGAALLLLLAYRLINRYFPRATR